MPIVDGPVTTPLVLQDTLDLFELMEAGGAGTPIASYPKFNE